jgi:hypothetical protein
VAFLQSREAALLHTSTTAIKKRKKEEEGKRKNITGEPKKIATQGRSK